jgi:hypothetical protein
MKTFFALSLVAVTAWSHAETPATTFTVFGGDKPTGKAYCKLEPTPEGGRRFVMTLILRLGGRDLQIRSESTYDSTGLALSRRQETGKPGKPADDIVDVTFGIDKALVKETKGGQLTTKEVAIDAKLPRADALMKWTPNRFPSPGSELALYSFDMAKHTFNLAKAIYEGVDSLALDGKKVSAHRIVTESRGNRYEIWVDDNGMPYRMSLGTFRLDRVMSGA